MKVQLFTSHKTCKYHPTNPTHVIGFGWVEPLRQCQINPTHTNPINYHNKAF